MRTATKLDRGAASIAIVMSLLFGSCLFGSRPVGVEPRGEASLHEDLDVCALHGDVPSAWSSWVLRLTEQEDEFDDNPLATVRVLHERAVELRGRNLLFSLSELCYLAGKRRDDRACFLAAAVYAHLFLLSDAEPGPPSPYDRRFRWACDLYNRSLVRAFKAPDQDGLRLEQGTRELPVGSLNVTVDTSAFPFDTADLELLPADELEVRGLGFRVRDSGLGAPLVAIVRRTNEDTAGVVDEHRGSVSATAFLRLQGGLDDVALGMPAEIELHSTADATEIEVAGHKVPLEADVTATIAHGIETADLWRFDISGLFGGENAARQNGLIVMRPYERGRIPVVLVHGTASNPSYWAELINSLNADPVLRERVQFWLFFYSTGNPIVYSAATLRESLVEMLAKLDPDGTDEALRHTVVVGHSQGGLLTKLLGVHLEAERASQAILGSSFDELDLDEPQKKLARRCFDLEPLPFVERLVFVATPHRGSVFAASWLVRTSAKLIAVPGELVGFTKALANGIPDDRLPSEMSSRVPTSLDNMNPKNPTLRLLVELPVDPRIQTHSIIAIGDSTDPTGADDGFVSYESAHLDGVESEVLVPCGHSCQEHARTIIEMRRILREHIETVGELSGGGS